MAFEFPRIEPWPEVSEENWQDWKWQLRQALVTPSDFAGYFQLSAQEELGLAQAGRLFKAQTTPYYASLAHREDPEDPIRKMIVPTAQESEPGRQQMPDPLGERKNSPRSRLVHRYPDRVLFLVTDICSVYCRYCLRKYFTAKDQAFLSPEEYREALAYIQSNSGIKEVILSGGDPLTLSDQRLEQILRDLRSIKHVEIIRIGTRMPVVAPMRITPELVAMLKAFHPVYVMNHFNHPAELTSESARALNLLADNGFPLFNQMVLLKGVNDRAQIVEALSRRLLYLRVKPYYMFQCDPSEGTDHLRTTIEESLAIQREMWGRVSGLAMPNLSVDIPGGGGKVGLVPDFVLSRQPGRWRFRGWDGIEGDYI